MDPDAFNAFEAAGWDERATTYHRLFLPLTRLVIEPLLDRAAVGPGTRVLDVGSGAGKLCLVGAMFHPGQFTGLERRAELVDVSRQLAARLGLDVAFQLGELSAVDWGRFDAFYFFNPFAEHFAPGADGSPPDRARFFRDVQEAKDRLRVAPDGTRVVTYHGLGACLPGCYRLHLREPAGHDSLDLWIKAGMSEAAAKNYLGAIADSLNSPNMVLDLRIPQNQRYQQIVLDTAIARLLAGEIDRDQAMADIEAGWNEITEELGADEQLAAYKATLGIRAE